MVFSDEFKKKINVFFALGVTSVAFLFLVLRFDIFYELNDDVLMKDILSGIYSGTPETRNMQMLYPMSFVMAVLYNLIPFVPWYGAFLVISQFVCLYLIAERSMQFCAKIVGKFIMSFTILAAWCTLLLYHFVFLQYTVTAGVLVGTALFRFMTNYSTDPDKISFTQDTARVTQDNMPVGLFVRKNVFNMILLATAFLLRSEMALLTLPLVGVAFILKWAEESPVFTRENVEKFVSVLLIVVVSCSLFYGLDKIAYSRISWKNFTTLFEARTELYDFLQIPSYEENQEFYDSIEISDKEHTLLTTYNYGLCEKIDYEKMNQIASYAKQLDADTTSPVEKMSAALWKYRTSLTSREFILYTSICVLLILLILVSAILQGHFKVIFKVLLFLAFRSGSWMYLYYRGRIVERVTTPLYFVEIMVLISMLLMEYGIVVVKQKGYSTELRRMRIMTKWEERRGTAIRVCPIVALAIICFTSICTAFRGYQETVSEYKNRVEAESYFHKLKQYCKEHSEQFFYEDVYSTTSVVLADGETCVYTAEKVFADVSTNYGNYELLGGWICKSPLQKDKFAYATKKGIDTSFRYFLIEQNRDTSFLTQYFESLGENVTLTEIDSIEDEKVQSVMKVYELLIEENEEQNESE